MIYIYSQQEIIKNYWTNEFEARVVEEDFYLEEKNFQTNDILVLDLDNFETVEQTLFYIDNVSNLLNIIALVEVPRLAHGTLMVKKGCKSYIGKKTSKIIVKEVLKTVQEGNVWLYPELMNYIIKNITVDTEKQIDKKKLSVLSSKELEVAQLVAKGDSNKEISKQLDIQLVTVKKHIGNIFTKLKVKDRVSLAIFINKNKD